MSIIKGLIEILYKLAEPQCNGFWCKNQACEDCLEISKTKEELHICCVFCHLFHNEECCAFCEKFNLTL